MGLFSKLFGTNTTGNTRSTAPTQYNPSTHNNMVQAMNKYHEGREKIESSWSVISNLKDFNGERATELEKLCYDNLKNLDLMRKAQKQAKYDDSIPPQVPAYVRLVMLYEKQERYMDAINTCARAIRAGAIRDGSKGMMKGRLARLVKKANTTVPEDILKLLD